MATIVIPTHRGNTDLKFSPGKFDYDKPDLKFEFATGGSYSLESPSTPPQCLVARGAMGWWINFRSEYSGLIDVEYWGETDGTFKWNGGHREPVMGFGPATYHFDCTKATSVGYEVNPEANSVANYIAVFKLTFTPR